MHICINYSKLWGILWKRDGNIKREVLFFEEVSFGVGVHSRSPKKKMKCEVVGL